MSITSTGFNDSQYKPRYSQSLLFSIFYCTPLEHNFSLFLFSVKYMYGSMEEAWLMLASWLVSQQIAQRSLISPNEHFLFRFKDVRCVSRQIFWDLSSWNFLSQDQPWNRFVSRWDTGHLLWSYYAWNTSLGVIGWKILPSCYRKTT